MNNPFTPRVSDIINYSKEEAIRLKNSYIGPEHLLLGILREGEGKAIEVLFNLQIDLKQLKIEMENRLPAYQEGDVMDEKELNFNDVASRILKLCILESKQMKCEAVDSEHILLAIMRQKNNKASQLLEEHEVRAELQLYPYHSRRRGRGDRRDRRHLSLRQALRGF